MTSHDHVSVKTSCCIIPNVPSSRCHVYVIDVTQSDAEVTDSVHMIEVILPCPDDVRYWPAPPSTDQLHVISLGQRHPITVKLVGDRSR